jgi:hypothetical protein
MKEILMELDILRERMEKHSDDISFCQILYSITRTLNKSDLLKMTEEDLIKHIQKIQILES